MSELTITVEYGAIPKRLMAEVSRPVLMKLAATSAINAALPFVQRELTLATPVGATGKARQMVSMHPAFAFGNEIVGYVGYGAPASLYIPFVELGTRPHWPPIAPIRLWAARVLGDPEAAYAVARAIAYRGGRPKRFIRTTRTRIKPMVKEIMARVITEVLRGR